MENSANFFGSGDGSRAARLDAGQQRNSNPFAAMVERYWRAVRRHLIAAAAIVVLALILAVLATLLAIPKYSATARLEIAREQAKITNVEGLEPEQSNQDREFYQTQYSLLVARSVAQRVAGALNVVSNDHFFDGLDVDIDTMLSNANIPSGIPAARFRLRKATDMLLSRVEVQPVTGSRLVDVTFTSPSAQLSTEVANLWVDEFQKAAVARRYESTDDARQFLEKQLDDMRKKLEDSQRRLVSYAAANQIISLASSRDLKGNTQSSETLRSADLKALNQALSAATADRIEAESQTGHSGSSSVQALTNLALNNMRERRAEVASQLAQQESIFEPEYPSVQALQAQLDELDASIAREEKRIQDAAQTAYQDALKREQVMQAQVNRLKSATIEEQRASIQYAIYQREVDTNRELYEGLLQRYKEIGVAGVGASNISVVDRATLPERPASPSMPLNLALGLIMGLGLAGGYVFVREQIDQSIQDPSQVTELFDLALLGTIPEVTGEIDEELEDSKSPVSEAYFSTATNLTFLTPTGAPKSFGVCSTRPNEGKSTSVYALGVALARTGKRTLLIDCDLRNPSQHEHFNQTKEPGLSNLLTSQDDADFSDYVQSTRWSNLFFMPAGPIAPNPGALLIDDSLAQIVAKASEMFDHVIVDGPPLLGLADAPLIARAVEGVIYTIEANGVRSRAIEAGLSRLHFSGSTIFGALVTKANSLNTSYGYGYGYGYQYGPKTSDDDG